MDYAILIYWTSPFLILGVSGVFFHFYINFLQKSCMQTVKTLIRRMWRLIWVCTGCLGPKNGTLGLYGLKIAFQKDGPVNIRRLKSSLYLVEALTISHHLVMLFPQFS